MTRGDRWLFVSVLTLAVLLVPVTLVLAGPDGTHATVTTPDDGTSVDLTSSGRHVVAGLLGDVVLEVEDEAIRVVESPCPQELCLEMGPVSRSGEVIVCVPGGITIVVGEPSAGVDHVVR